MKAIGLNVILAQAGFYVACSEFQIKPYTQIFTRILNNDNIFRGQSSFAVEMIELKSIFQMSDKKISLWDLEKHETKDTLDSHINGELTVVWRDWDNLIKDHPKMVYINSINPGEKKGPHLHKKRTTYFSCIRGKILLIAQEKRP